MGRERVVGKFTQVKEIKLQPKGFGEHAGGELAHLVLSSYAVLDGDIKGENLP